MTGEEIDAIVDLHKELWPRSLGNATQKGRLMAAIRGFPQQTTENALMRLYDAAPRTPPPIDKLRSTVTAMLPRKEREKVERYVQPCCCVPCMWRRNHPNDMSTDDDIRHDYVATMLRRYRDRHEDPSRIPEGTMQRLKQTYEREVWAECRKDQDAELNQASERPLKHYLEHLPDDHSLRLWVDADIAKPATSKDPARLKQQKEAEREAKRRAAKRRVEATAQWKERKQSLLEALKEEL